MPKFALKAQIFVAAILLAGAGMVFAQIAEHQQKLGDMTPSGDILHTADAGGTAPQGIDPQGNNLPGRTGGNDMLGNLASAPLDGPRPVVAGNPLDGTGPISGGPLQGEALQTSSTSLDGTISYLGAGPIAGFGRGSGDGSLVGAGPLQGAAPTLGGDPAGVGSPVITAGLDKTPSTSPYIPELEPPPPVTPAPPPSNPPGNQTVSLPPVSPPQPPGTPPTPPPTPCCAVTPPAAPQPPIVYPPCQANASGCT